MGCRLMATLSMRQPCQTGIFLRGSLVCLFLGYPYRFIVCPDAKSNHTRAQIASYFKAACDGFPLVGHFKPLPNNDDGRTILDVFRVDFRDRSGAYYEYAIKTGAILLNDQLVPPDTIIKNNNRITNRVHRHEPPVIEDPVKVIHRDEEKGLLVVEKPGSIPVHVTGRYRFNTLLEILQHDYNIQNVYTCNRLDRLTSGIMVCATNKEAARYLGDLFNNDSDVRKEYVCRAIGCFPENEVVCEEPLLAIDRQLGLNAVHPEGRVGCLRDPSLFSLSDPQKPSKTIFQRLSYHAPSNTSLILCKPVTGRSHQIRVHLQFLGHPIANDPVYNNAAAWGRQRGKGGVFPVADAATEASFLQKTLESNPIRKRLPPSKDNLDTGAPVPLTDDIKRAIVSLRQTKDQDDDFARFKDLDFVPSSVPQSAEGYCLECGLPLLPDPKPAQLCIWLHAKRYSSKRGGWDFQSPELPRWAQDEWADWEKQMADIAEIVNNQVD